MGTNQSTVRKERSGWRDLALNDRHRVWGFDCPALDIDFLLVEYDTCTPVAIVEYKHESATMLEPDNPGRRVLKKLGDAAGLPVFVSRYTGGFEKFMVGAVNGLAREYLGEPRREMSELEWVRFLYRLRDRDLPADVDSFLTRDRAIHPHGHVTAEDLQQVGREAFARFTL